MEIWGHWNLISSLLLPNQASLCGSGSGIQENPKLPLGWTSTGARNHAGKIDMPGIFVTDGRMPFPVNHGSSSEDLLLQVSFGIHLK